jgi:hypothetical protein
LNWRRKAIPSPSSTPPGWLNSPSPQKSRQRRSDVLIAG